MILEQLTDSVSAAVWNLHPGWAVEAGKHQYDGQVPDLSAGAIEAALERLGRLREQLAGLAGLTSEQSVDREVLLGVIDRERFDLQRAVRWRRDPAWYLEPLDISVYLERDYAPGGLRLERAASLLGEAGSLLGAARANLSEGLPRAWAEHAVGLAQRQAARLPAQAGWAPAARRAPAEAAWLREAASYAAAELEAYAAWLEAERLPGAAEEFALGREGLDSWLGAAEGLEPGWDIRAAWGARLRKDQEALAADAARSAPGLSIDEACLRVATEGAGDPVAAGRRSLEEARRCADRLGLPAPGADPPVVAAGPGVAEPGRAGWLQAPGPYDDPATSLTLFVVPGSSPAALDAAVVTEGLPGRPTGPRPAVGSAETARRRFASRGFREGWGLYAGDLMAEAGFREEAPGWRLLWRRRVIVADCHLVLGPSLHCGDLPLEQVVQGFHQEAGLPLPAARLEALRCARDPGCFLGALGRVKFIAAAGPGDGGSLRGFYSSLPSASALPLGLLDRLPM
jgi:hypothetical protein